jgi:hypothetical protein
MSENFFSSAALRQAVITERMRSWVVAYVSLSVVSVIVDNDQVD